MVSRINDSQNFNDEYFEKFGFPMIFCKSHQQFVIESINLNHLNPNKLVCTKCLIKDRLNPEFLISIQEIFSKNPSNIIQNWPPMLDPSIHLHLITYNVQESKKNQSIELIDEYFSVFKADILKIIDELQKKILVHINIIEENRQALMDVYNQISEKDKMIDQILQKKNNLKELEEYFKQLISSKQTKANDNQQKIKSAFDIFTKSQKQFEFDYIDKIFQQLLTNFKKIDILNPNKMIEETKQNSQIVENRINQQQINIDETDLLQSLKIIKSGFGKPEYISFKKIQLNYFEIERDQSSKNWSQVMIDQELITENKYEIQIELKSINNNNDDMVLGLLPISQKDQYGWQHKLSLYTQKADNGVDKIESGKHISDIRKDVKQMKFQIFVKEKILRCLAVVNNQKNINSLVNLDNLKLNEKYYFYIAFYHPNSKIQIQQFKTVKQFDNW